MNTEKISRTMQDYVDNGELLGAELLIRQHGEIIMRECWGRTRFADRPDANRNNSPAIYRMMSMTKPVTAAAVLILIGRGKIGLDEPLSTYIPEFRGMRTMDDPRYIWDSAKLKKLPLMLLTFSMKHVKSRPASREVTIRDLLSHSSGIQQGMAGLLAMLKCRKQYRTLRECALSYSEHVLDFDPGTGTGYSPLAGFDILGYVVEVVSGMSLEEFLQKEICVPLGMKDTTFFLNEEQKTRLVDVCCRKKGKLENVTATPKDMAGAMHQKDILFEHGCGGLFSTLADYDRFCQMLAAGGVWEGKQILPSELARVMHEEAPANHLEPDPGNVWGLGVKIRQDPSKSGSPVTSGTYGWSGAFGTHFFISPEDDLTVIFLTNRSDLGGSGSYISSKLEQMIFES